MTGKRGGPVLSARAWPSNAAMIREVAKLGYLSGRVIDPTYGRGTWYRDWRPDPFVTHDLAVDGVDFRALPEGNGTFDAAVFDPPYVWARPTENDEYAARFHSRYGLGTWESGGVEGIRKLIQDGLCEVARVVRVGGYVLVKTADYIVNHRLVPGTEETYCFATGLGLCLVDKFVYVRGALPQPRTQNQEHARQNSSVLYVFQKGAGIGMLRARIGAKVR